MDVPTETTGLFFRHYRFDAVGDVSEDDEIEGDDESLDDAAFIEEQEDGDPDVTDIIGDGIEKEEEQ